MKRASVMFMVCLAGAACDDGASDGGAYYGDAGMAAPSGDRGDTGRTNPFVDPAEDNQITFSVDVDTGSYTLARDRIQRGALPDPSTVRVEEFINFFDYRDAPPQTLETPFAVHTQVAPSPFGEGLHLMRVALKGYEVERSERPPANLVFLVDVSGSMQGPNKLDLVKYALRRLTDTLRADDTVGLVVYASNSGVRLDPTPISERGTILNAVDGLRAGGSTNGGAGIQTAYRLAESAFKADGVNRVILCSDGDFNVGLTGAALIELIDEKRAAGVSLSVFGFGQGNYNDHDMEQMADHGDGNYAYIDKEAEAERVLVRNITGTLLTIAKDVKIQVDVNADLVERYRLIGYENRDIADRDFRNDSVDAGEIGAGHTVTALIEVALAEGFRAGELASVKVRWKDPADADRVGEISHPIRGDAVFDVFAEAGRGFRFGAAVAEFAEILRGSAHSQDRRFDDIVDIARRAAFESDRDQAEFIDLVDAAKGM